MHILIWSTAPWIKTGYGKNCLHFMKIFKELGHDVSIISTYGLMGGAIDIGGVKVFPSNNNFYQMGSWIKYWEDQLLPDIILQHFDVWTVEAGFIHNDEIRTPLITHTPVDSSPMPRLIKECASGAYDNLAMSGFAHKAFRANNMPSQRVIYHPVDNSIFRPIPKEDARKAIGLPQDGFIIGCVGTNKGPRKNIIGQLRAFYNFLNNNSLWEEPVYMYLHTYLTNDFRNPEGLDIPSIIDHFGLESHIYFTDLDTYYAGFSDEQMRDIYASFDCLSICSMAEGFGIPIIEAQACGIPVITTNFSAMPEVMGDGGLLVEPAELMTWQRLGCAHAVPSEKEIEKRYLEIYENKHPRLSDKAILNSSRFHIDNIKIQWKHYLEDL